MSWRLPSRLDPPPNLGSIALYCFVSRGRGDYASTAQWTSSKRMMAESRASLASFNSRNNSITKYMPFLYNLGQGGGLGTDFGGVTPRCSKKYIYALSIWGGIQGSYNSTCRVMNDLITNSTLLKKICYIIPQFPPI